VKTEKELPDWKQKQRRIIKDAVTNHGSTFWKLPRTGFRIPENALWAMNSRMVRM